MVASFSNEDLSAIVQAPMIASMAIAAADLGIVSTAMEAAAMAREISTAAQKYPSNSVIQSAFSEEALKSGAVKAEVSDMKAEDVQSGAILDKAIDSVNSAITLLEGKATAEEISEYKSFIYSCAEAVANAAGSGLFGRGNPKVSDKEASALAKLKTALGLA